MRRSTNVNGCKIAHLKMIVLGMIGASILVVLMAILSTYVLDINADTNTEFIHIPPAVGIKTSEENVVKQNTIVSNKSHINRMDLIKPCGYTSDELRKGLLTGLKPYADSFIEAEKKYGVNALFLASVAAQESGWGSSNIAVNKNNIYGWTSSSGFRQFNSIDECIDHVAMKLKVNYLTPNGVCFNGYSIEDVSIKYSMSDPIWVTNVRAIMYEIQERIDT